MSHFYGTLQGNRGEATRCGSKSSGVVTYAASWQGAVRVQLYYDEATGKDMASVELVPWRGVGAYQTIYDGPVGGIEAAKEEVAA